MSGTRERSTRSKDRQEDQAPKSLNVSGSDWSEDHLVAFNIVNLRRDNLLIFLKEKGVPPYTPRLNSDVSQLLSDTIGANAQYGHLPHADLFEKAKNLQLGPFLAFLAMVTQAWRGTEEAGSRKSPRLAAKKTSASQGAETKALLEVVDEAFTTPQKSSPSISPATLEQTPKHVAAREQKAEIVTNTMAVLFLQAILESSRKSLTSSAHNYLEWHFIPTWLRVSSSKAKGQTVNDGSLFRKHLQKRGDGHEWIRADNLLYASIEVGGRFAPPREESSLQGLTSCRQSLNMVYGKTICTNRHQKFKPRKLPK
jgi:hypothetical protein